MTKLSDYVINFIAAQGVKHIFLLPGGGCIHLIDSIGRSCELDFVCNLHEQGCAIAAEAYGQYTNNCGVCLVTTGPGGTNAITGLAGAWLESTPCLFISGQVKRADLKASSGLRQKGFQEVDIIAVVKSLCKYAVTLMDPREIRFHLEKAFYLMHQGRPGPVWLDIPLDVQAQEIDEASLAPYAPDTPGSNVDPKLLSHEVARAIALLNESKRPIILVGNGVRLAKAQAEFMQLIQFLQIPVLTTWKTIDFIAEDDPLFAGRPGICGQRAANFAQQNSDWFLAIGARLDYGQTAFNPCNIAPRARKIIVDIDGAELEKLGNGMDIRLTADAGEFIREFLRQKKAVSPIHRGAWLSRIAEWRRTYPVITAEHWKLENAVSQYALLDILSAEMPPNSILVPGSSGAASEVTCQAFKSKADVRVLNTQGLGAMGFAIPAAIGACLAGGKKPTICIDGDGSFQMNIQELEVVRRLALPIKFFVLNNQGYVSIRNTQRSMMQGRFVACGPDSGLTLPDLVKVAAAYGLATAKIETHTHLREKVREVLACRTPLVCEVKISPDEITTPKVTSRFLSDGTVISEPMERMWPFLPEEEQRKNVLD